MSEALDRIVIDDFLHDPVDGETAIPYTDPITGTNGITLEKYRGPIHPQFVEIALREANAREALESIYLNNPNRLGNPAVDDNSDHVSILDSAPYDQDKEI